MKKTFILVGLFLISPMLTFADEWQTIESGRKEVEDYDAYHNEIIEKVKNLNEEAKKQDVLIEYRYTIVKEEKEVVTENIIDEAKTIVDMCFDSEVSAYNYLNTVELSSNQKILYKEVTKEENKEVTGEIKYTDCEDSTCAKEIEELKTTISNPDYIIKKTSIITEDAKGTELLDKEEALELQKTLEEKGYVVTLRSEEVTESTTSIEIPSKSFNTKEEAENYLKELKDQGYTIENYEIKEYTISTDAGKVINGTKVDESLKRYEFTDSNYVIIKQASNGLVVWTEEELTESEQTRFETSYKEICLENSVDGKNNCELSILRFINGYNTFDLSDLGNGWKNDYTFSKDNDKIILTIPSVGISHAIYGNYQVNKVEYTIEGKMHKEITTTKYYVDYKKMEDIYSLYYNSISTKTCYYLTYTKVTYETKPVFNVAYKIEKIEYGVGTDTPPHTGVEANNYYNYICIIALYIIKKIIF